LTDLDGVRQAFAAARAASTTRGAAALLRLGGRRVQLQVAGSELAASLTRAFAPLIENTEIDDPRNGEDGCIELRIGAWDRTATGVGCPGLALVPDRTDVLGPGLMFQYRAGQLLRYDRSSIVKCLDRRSGELFMCVQDAAQLGLNDRTRPFEHFLRAWAHDQSIHILHAGLVAHDGRGVLLAGRGGSGKSTTAIACALAGLDFLGDDFVATAATADGWRGHALYDTVRLERSGLDRFPSLEAHRVSPAQLHDGAKYLVYMSDVLGAARGRVVGTRLAAIVIPTIAGSGATFMRPVSRGEILRRLVPSTLLRALGGGASSFSHMTAMVRDLPCHELVLGTSVDAAPDLLRGVLHGCS